ncbi:MAG: M23 family metallopeptidase [Candidatus Dormibacteria bacterium]
MIRTPGPRVLGAIAGGLLAVLQLCLPTVLAASADPPCITGVTCPASPTPTAAPSPRPSATPTRAPSPRPAPAAAAPASTSPASPSPSPSASAPPATARFHNAPFLTQLLTVLNRPISARAPDLRHFRIDAASAARARADAAAAEKPRGRADGAPLAAVTLAAGIGLLVAGWFGPRRLKLNRGATTMIAAVLVAVAASGTAPSGSTSPTAARVARGIAPAVIAREVATVAPRAPSVQVNSQGPDWPALLAVELELSHNLDSLAQQEALIRTIASSATATAEPADPVATGPGADRGGRVDDEMQSQLRLQHLLEAYREATARYQDALRREYDVYRAAARDPARKQQLVVAAASSPRPEVKEAVTYNLALVQSRLDQEAAINGAEERLAALGSLSGAQLSAMKHHQPFIVPVQAPVVQGFGATDVGFEPPVTYRGTFYPHFHTGIDLTAPENAPVHVAADGVVLLASASRDAQGNYSGYGNYVVIAHPEGFVTLYGHLNALSVKEGDVVHQGQVLGLEGSTGLSTGPHVHFEIRHNNEWVDPMPYLTGQIAT